MWQPIDTAPKDGAVVILYDEDVGHVVTGFWADSLSAWICTCHRVDSDGTANPDAKPCFQHHLPTHWMLLPKTPGRDLQPAR